MSRLFPFLFFVFLAGCQPGSGDRHREAGEAGKPNIVLIVADDLGYGNLTCYNPASRVPTPNIDRLAENGTRFIQFYSGSTVCAPSRAALMTGLHMGHAYIRGNSREGLRAKDTTLAERLSKGGYATGMFGKWGLGEVGSAGMPQLKGFDEFFGYINQRHAHHYFTDSLYEIKNGKLQTVKTDTTQYTHAMIMERALSFVKDNKDAPFFLYLPVTLPHAELLVPDSLMQPFLQADGSSKLAPETPYYQRKGTYHTQLRPHAAFAAMITRLDKDVGRVVSLLKELGLDENTYVFFTSDNGPHKEGGADPEYFDSNGPLRGLKRDLYEGGIRVPMIVSAPGKDVPAGRTAEAVWAFWDLLPTICDLAGLPSPAGIDGLSFRAALEGKAQEQHDHLYWQFNEGMLKEAVLKDNWKLIRFKKKGEPERLELYDLSRDIGEEKDLSGDRPDKVRELRALMTASKTPPENKLFDWSDMEE